MKNKNIFVILNKNKITVKEGMFYENKEFCIITNNKLYDLNYKKINLKKIIELYKRNIELCNVISNSFSIIIIDKYNNTVSAIQDMNGDTIPLYYTNYNNELIFTNKLINIINNNRKLEMNIKSISYFIKKGYIPNKNTLVDGIFKVIPNYNLYIDMNNFKEKNIKKKIKYQKFKKDNTDLYIKEFKKILNNLEKNKNVFTALSNGYDSNFIYNFLNKNKHIEAFSIGGTSGVDETKMVSNNIKDYTNTSLNISYVSEKTLDNYPELVYLLEGSMYEKGIFLQYELSKSIKEKSNNNTVLFCGEGSDQIFSLIYYSNIYYWLSCLRYILSIVKHTGLYEELINLKVRGGFLHKFSYRDALTYVIIKKNGILMNDANISCVYPYLYKNIIDIAYINRKENYRLKESHIKACNREIDSNIIKNIKKIGGTTEPIALFKNCSYINKIEEFVNKSKFNILKIKKNLESDNYLDYLLKVLYLDIFEYIFIDKKCDNINNTSLLNILEEKYCS